MVVKLSEWESCGIWHAAFTDTFKKGMSNFAIVAHGCGMTADIFVKWVLENFKPDLVHYTADYSVVFFGWKSQSAMRKYKNTVNKILRDRQATI